MPRCTWASPGSQYAILRLQCLGGRALFGRPWLTNIVFHRRCTSPYLTSATSFSLIVPWFCEKGATMSTLMPRIPNRRAFRWCNQCWLLSLASRSEATVNCTYLSQRFNFRGLPKPVLQEHKALRDVVQSLGRLGVRFATKWREHPSLGSCGLGLWTLEGGSTARKAKSQGGPPQGRFLLKLGSMHEYSMVTVRAGSIWEGAELRKWWSQWARFQARASTPSLRGHLLARLQ